MLDMRCKKCDSDLEFKLQEGKERDGLLVLCPVCGQIARYRLREYDYACYPPAGYEKPKDVRPSEREVFERIQKGTNEMMEIHSETKRAQQLGDVQVVEKPKPKKKSAPIKTTPEKLELVEKSKETLL